MKKLIVCVFVIGLFGIRSAQAQLIESPLDDLSFNSTPPLPQVTPSQPAPILNAPAPSAQALPSQIGSSIPAQDPASLPAGNPVSVINTMANHGHVNATPNAANVPVDWCQGQGYAPNYVYDFLMRQSCVDGLWDNYGALRAAECAKQWHRLTKHQNCGCGSCSNCTPTCSSCSQPGCGILNRYTGAKSCLGGCKKVGCSEAPAPTCDTCNSDACAANTSVSHSSVQTVSASQVILR